MDKRVRHRRASIAGVDTSYREAGPPNAPVILLPHGYPCSSFEFQNLMPELADEWRLIAPDYPGFGYSDSPEDFSCMNRFNHGSPNEMSASCAVRSVHVRHRGGKKYRCIHDV